MRSVWRTALRLRDDTQVMYNLTVAEAHTFFVGDGQWLVHNACDQFLKELDNGAKIRAYFEEGIMWTSMWVPKDLRGQGLGNEPFNDAWNAIGGESRVRAIGGDWGTYMPDNLDSFNRNIANGMSEVDAALNTFTGKQAVKHRFTTVEFQQMSDGPPYKFVKVVFR